MISRLHQISVRYGGGYGAQQGGGGHFISRGLNQTRLRQNHIARKNLYIRMRGEQDKIASPDNRRYLNRHNICNNYYMVTKYETERLLRVCFEVPKKVHFRT